MGDTGQILWDMMETGKRAPRTWFTSDTHFGHRRLAELRGFGPATYIASDAVMDMRLIRAWNKRVRAGDSVYHLGDLSFRKPDVTASILRLLHGQKFLVAGNHDKRLVRDPVLRDCFGWVKDYHELRVPHDQLEAGKVVLMHYPLHVWNRSHHGSIHLHGHSHGSCPPVGRRMDVGVDTRPDMASWSLEEVLDALRDRPPAEVDHHRPRKEG